MGTRSLLAAWNADPPLALIVDRDADTRRLYAEYLRLAACVVEEAEDGREALAKAISHQPDVIITETRLPGMSGLELCDLLRSDASTRNIPIVIVTADAFHVPGEQMPAADAVLFKPCLPESVLAEIYRLLDRSIDLHDVTRVIHETMSKRLADVDGTDSGFRRTILSRTYQRVETTE